MVVGIDIDGVLADQIAGILPRISSRHGVDLGYEDIVHFRLPVADTDIAVEILVAMSDPDYIMEMPVHAGAREMLDELSRVHRVVLITARPAEALPATRRWLRRHRLAHSELVAAREGRKSLHGTDALVDDYAGNIAEFLERTNGRAILVAQPWNQDRTPIEHWLDSGRLSVVSSLAEVPRLLPRARLPCG